MTLRDRVEDLESRHRVREVILVLKELLKFLERLAEGHRRSITSFVIVQVPVMPDKENVANVNSRVTRPMQPVASAGSPQPQPKESESPVPVKAAAAVPALTPLAPGNTATFQAVPVPAGATVAAGQPLPVWTSSDNVNAPVSVDPSDPTDLTVQVAFPTTATVNPAVTLSVTYTNADGVVANGSVTFAMVPATPPPPPAEDITSFTVSQTA